MANLRDCFSILSRVLAAIRGGATDTGMGFCGHVVAIEIPPPPRGRDCNVNRRKLSVDTPRN